MAKVITPMKKLRYIVLTATCGIFFVIGLAEAADATGGSTQVAPAGQQAATVQATRGKGSITIGDETRSFDVEFCNVTQSVGQGGVTGTNRELERECGLLARAGSMLPTRS